MLAILQFDAASRPLLEELLEQGRMPALAELRRCGHWRELASPGAYLEGSVATTLHTGVEPGDHGIHFPFQWSSADQRVRLVDHLPAPLYAWERLAVAGRRTLLIDPYDSRRPRCFEGIGLSGWQFANRVVLRRWSVPHGAHRRLARRFGRPPAGDEVFGRPRVSELMRLRRRLLAAPSRIACVATEALQSQRFDLVWVNFAAAHVAGHRFWDPLPDVTANGAVGTENRARLETALVDVYRSVDEAIGRIRRALPAEADIIVLSPTGMGENRNLAHLLPGMLDAVLGHRSGAAERALGGGAALDRIRGSLPVPLRASAARALPNRLALELTAALAVSRRDWERTRAFAVPGDPEGAVQFNLAGRERHGIVDPAEADALADEIGAGLMSFRYPDGGAAIAAVERASELVPAGSRSDLLPDLVVGFGERPARNVERLSSPWFGEVAGAGIGTGRSGNHVPGAWALAVPGASSLREPSRPARLVDITATACSLLGGDIEGLRGEPLLATSLAR